MFDKVKKNNLVEYLISLASQRRILIFVFILVLLIPFPTTIVPEWKIRAVDENGNPAISATFRQNWDHYSYDVHGVEFRKSDENGFVIFPKRTFTVPLIYRIVRSASAYLLLFMHGSVGRDSTINAFTDKCSSDLIKFNSNKSLPEIIVVSC